MASAASLVAFAIHCLVLGLPGPGHSALPDRPAPSLRFVTFNLFHGGPYSGLTGNDRRLDRRLDLAIEELDALRPDVIGLQEASAGRGRGNVAERLARKLGFFHAYALANPRPFGGAWVHRTLAALLNFSEGPAIVSRFPILARHVHRLPRCAGPVAESRLVLTATLETPWGPMEVFSTHTRGDPCQTGVVAEIVSQGARLLPGVLLGDFNAAEGSPALAPFHQDARFVDAFRAANRSGAGATVWQRLDVPEPTASRRVDYIFVLRDAQGRGAVRSSRVVLNRPRILEDGTALWPSDHYGVLAEVTLGGDVGVR